MSNAIQGQSAGVAGPNPVTPKPEITHIEIRRVQNGFVVMGINADVNEQYALYRGPQRWSYVAKDTAELGALLSWIVDGKDINWVPSMDLPIIDLHRRVDSAGNQVAGLKVDLNAFNKP